MEKTEKIQLPYNYEAILKDADSPVDMSSMDKLLSQLHAGVFLNQKRKKYWVDKKLNKNCFMLFARDLSITCAEDYLVSIHIRISTCNYSFSLLSPGTLYGVVIHCYVERSSIWMGSSGGLQTCSSNGRKVERKEKLMTKPRRKWIEIPVGELTTSPENVGELEIYLHEYIMQGYGREDSLLKELPFSQRTKLWNSIFSK